MEPKCKMQRQQISDCILPSCFEGKLALVPAFVTAFELHHREAFLGEFHCGGRGQLTNARVAAEHVQRARTKASQPSPLGPWEVPSARYMTGYEIPGFAHVNDHELVTLFHPAVQFDGPNR